MNPSTNIADYLITAKSLIENPENYTSGELAQDANGNDLEAYTDPKAVKHNFISAFLMSIYYLHSRRMSEEDSDKVFESYKKHTGRQLYNEDGTSHKDALKLYDNMIQDFTDN